MELHLPRLTIRSWQPGDAPQLAALADNRAIWRNLRDRFPHPYRLEDAQAFIAQSLGRDPQVNYAITLDGTAIGSVGISPGEDIYRKSAEFGYWLGEPYWGRGYATEVIAAFTDWAFAHFDLERIYAMVFTWNPASARALEKCGFVCEATCRNAAVKDGEVVDEWLYSRVRDR